MPAFELKADVQPRFSAIEISTTAFGVERTSFEMTLALAGQVFDFKICLGLLVFTLTRLILLLPGSCSLLRLFICHVVALVMVWPPARPAILSSIPAAPSSPGLPPSAGRRGEEPATG